MAGQRGEGPGRPQADYLVIQHLEPDHAGSIEVLANKYPEMQFVSNPKLFGMMGQFFEFDFQSRQVVVNEGDTLSLGKHTLAFVMAPMVHWPEVMVTYEATEKILFSADGFGKFGALDTEEDWDCEARRYFINIVGKYGANVMALLKKAATLDIATICPLHGPILKENLGHYIGKYLSLGQLWARGRGRHHRLRLYPRQHRQGGKAAGQDAGGTGTEGHPLRSGPLRHGGGH